MMLETILRLARERVARDRRIFAAERLNVAVALLVYAVPAPIEPRLYFLFDPFFAAGGDFVGVPHFERLANQSLLRDFVAVPGVVAARFVGVAQVAERSFRRPPVFVVRRPRDENLSVSALLVVPHFCGRVFAFRRRFLDDDRSG